MLERSQDNNTFTMQQEALHAARTKLGDILTYPWDENSLEKESNLIVVLDTDSSNYKKEINTIRRVGHVKAKKRRKFSSYDLNASPIGGIINTIIDIGDFNNKSNKIVEQKSDNEDAGVLDYRYDFDMNTTVSYVSDVKPATGSVFNFSTSGVTAVTTNIKMIQIKLKGAGISTFTLRSYSSNIGESQLLRREY